MQVIKPLTAGLPETVNLSSDDEKTELVNNLLKKRNRNKPCICRSGKKLKHCCLRELVKIKKQLDQKTKEFCDVCIYSKK